MVRLRHPHRRQLSVKYSRKVRRKRRRHSRRDNEPRWAESRASLQRNAPRRRAVPDDYLPKHNKFIPKRIVSSTPSLRQFNYAPWNTVWVSGAFTTSERDNGNPFPHLPSSQFLLLPLLLRSWPHKSSLGVWRSTVNTPAGPQPKSNLVQFCALKYDIW